MKGYYWLRPVGYPMYQVGFCQALHKLPFLRFADDKKTY